MPWIFSLHSAAASYTLDTSVSHVPTGISLKTSSRALQALPILCALHAAVLRARKRLGSRRPLQRLNVDKDEKEDPGAAGKAFDLRAALGPPQPGDDANERKRAVTAFKAFDLRAALGLPEPGDDANERKRRVAAGRTCSMRAALGLPEPGDDANERKRWVAACSTCSNPPFALIRVVTWLWESERRPHAA